MKVRSRYYGKPRHREVPMNESRPRRLHPLHTLVLSLLLAILSGWLLQVGKNLLLPVFLALISVYVLVALADWLRKVPRLGSAPAWLRRLLVLCGFVGVLLLLTGIVISTGEKMIATAPTYQENLKRLLDSVTTWLGMAQSPDWQSIRAATIDRVNLATLLGTVLGSVGSLLGIVIMVAVYAMFLLGERDDFAHKLEVAMPGESAAQTRKLIGDINRRIGDYLAVKTLVNVILAALSFIILWLCGVDFALFWAVVIGLLNYIPYVGSFLGVLFPVVLALAQFGSLHMMLLVLILLSAAQMYVGNVLEPKMVGKQVNLSPFVVLVALSLWTSLWGVAGAVLAIPLTSIITIILAAFAPTRPLAVLLAENVDEFVTDTASRAETAAPDEPFLP